MQTSTIADDDEFVALMLRDVPSPPVGTAVIRAENLRLPPTVKA